MMPLSMALSWNYFSAYIVPVSRHFEEKKEKKKSATLAALDHDLFYNHIMMCKWLVAIDSDELIVEKSAGWITVVVFVVGQETEVRRLPTLLSLQTKKRHRARERRPHVFRHNYGENVRKG